jgi:hypothetical protein
MDLTTSSMPLLLLLFDSVKNAETFSVRTIRATATKANLHVAESFSPVGKSMLALIRVSKKGGASTG